MGDAKEYALEMARSGGIGDLEGLWTKVKAAALEEAGGAAALGCGLLAAMLLGNLCGQLDGPARSAGIACRAAEGIALAGWLAGCVRSAGDWADAIRKVEEGITPILTGLMVALGAEGTSAALGTLMGICQWAAGMLLTRAGPALCCASAAVAAAGSLGPGVRLKRLSKALSDGAGWLSGGLLSAFLALAGAAGALASARDGVAMRSAKFAVDSMFPVVGGELADALGAAAGSSLVVKNAVGVTGAVILLGVCARPFLRLALTAISCRLALALGEPVGDGGMAEMGEGFLRAIHGLMASLTAAAVMALIWIGVALSFGRSAMQIAS